MSDSYKEKNNEGKSVINLSVFKWKVYCTTTKTSATAGKVARSCENSKLHNNIDKEEEVKVMKLKNWV